MASVLIVQNTASISQVASLAKTLVQMKSNASTFAEGDADAKDLGAIAAKVRQADIVAVCLTGPHLTALAAAVIGVAKRLGIRIVAVWMEEASADSRLPDELQRYGSGAANSSPATIRKVIVEGDSIWVNAAGTARPAAMMKRNKCKKKKASGGAAA